MGWIPRASRRNSRRGACNLLQHFLPPPPRCSAACPPLPSAQRHHHTYCRLQERLDEEVGEGDGDGEGEGEDDGEEEGSKEKASDGCAAGSPLLTLEDESTKTPGLFLVGPAVRHGELSFCFVYKFRQRFAVVADAVSRGLGIDTEQAVDACRDMNMFLDDFECCKAACGEAC